MYKVDLHQRNETVASALYNLKESIRIARSSKDHVLCLVVGYGSTGGTHKIKTAVLEQLREYKSKNQIRDFIIGSEIDIFNANYQKLKGKEFLDEDCKRRKNPGEILVIL
ncbi:MAG: hypothetical protein K2N64_06975 [Anaeroplasmataceae bacterium]|nr:hypothetical protein [Anaeroplasmataceae bacterium]